MEDDPQRELTSVKQELALLQEQISGLLERQQTLLEKKSSLEEIIRETYSSQASSGLRASYTGTDFPWSEQLEDLKSMVFKLDAFRPLQLQTMNATLSGTDCILIMPTGGGKSLCFHLPALVSNGITLVVSPLVALMKDQTLALEALDVDACLLNASSSRAEVNTIHSAMIDKKSTLKLLYVTPEKLAKSKRFMAKLEKMYSLGRFSRLVVDEVHCCSQWGHDFRPDYKFLGIMKQQFPGVPILGLTATATNHVIHDVKKILRIPECLVLKASFNRKNLYYEVRSKPSSMKASVEEIYKLINGRFKQQSGIVYCLSQKDTEDVMKELQRLGIKSGCYHANLDADYRNHVHTSWLKDKIQVVVATVAFGMGIDKPNVRFVIHQTLSKSMETYYQESGRAGRDGQPAWCILFAGFADISRQSSMVFTEQTGLDKLYGMVHYAYDLKRCRRSLIASHFAEVWDSQCNKMCDHCSSSSSGSVVKTDVTQQCRDIIKVLNNCKKDERLTALKLLNKCKSVPGKGLHVSRAERLIVYMLLKSYLREDFHFTPYKTISYVLPGPREKLLLMSDHVLEIYLPGSSLAAKNNSSHSSSRISEHNNYSGPKKRKTIVTKSEKSSLPSAENETHSDKTAPAVNNKLNKSIDKKAKKRKKAVIESDDDDFNFGEMDLDVVLPSPREKLLLMSDHVLEIYLPGSSLAAKNNSSHSSSRISEHNNYSGPKKRKTIVTKSEKSSLPSAENETHSDKTAPAVNNKLNKSIDKKAKKRKKAVIESDDDDFNFGEMDLDVVLPSKSVKQNCIVIDSEDEMSNF